MRLGSGFGVALRCVIAAATILTASAADARPPRIVYVAQDANTNVNTPIVTFDPLDALGVLSDHLRNGGSASGGECTEWVAGTAVTVTGRSISLTCLNGERYEHVFNAMGYAIVASAPDRVVTQFGWPLVVVQHPPDEVEAATRFLEAGRFLGAARSPLDPLQDADFQANLRASAPMDTERLRRTQVRVEAAVRSDRRIEAARLYRDALRTAPAWADGHYNLGLLYRELELYPEAITEMRRYLYLTPNAADARAVQDQIYEWEAAMGGPH